MDYFCVKYLLFCTCNCIIFYNNRDSQTVDENYSNNFCCMIGKVNKLITGFTDYFVHRQRYNS